MDTLATVAHILRTCSLIALLTLPGCTVWRIGPATSEVSLELPAAWHATSEGVHGKISTGWLAEFQDHRLSALVLEAVANNPNLNATAERLKAARANTIIGRANRLPTLGTGSSTTQGYDGLGPGPGVSFESYSASLNSSWEIDLWGRLRDQELATRADYRAAVANYRAIRLSLAANTARAWINLITAQQQLDLAEGTLISFKANLNIIERRHRANLLRAVDVQFGRNNVATAERNVRNSTLNRNEAARTLELLLGRYPSSELQASSSLPTLKRNVPAGLPSELVARRPDLIAARADLFASAKRAVADRKDLLPNLQLTGSGGNTSSIFRQAIDPGFFAWSVTASLSQTLYDGGVRAAQARAALAQNKAAIHDYIETALSAFREVESALEAESSLREQEAFLLQEVEQASQAERQSERDLALGIDGSTVLEILEAQRRAVGARATLIQLRNQRLQNRLDLHLALGGDFETLSESDLMISPLSR